MNKILIIALLILVPASASAATDYFLKLGDIKGEMQMQGTVAVPTSEPEPAAEPTRAPTTPTTEPERVAAPTTASTSPEPQAAGADMFLEIEGVKGETKESAPKKSKVEGINIKQSAQEGVEPDEIDYDGGDQPLMPDLAILLGGAGENDENANTARAARATILLNAMQTAGKPVETMSINFEKIKMTMAHPVRLFGFVPVSARVGVEMSSDAKVSVQFPWWAILATGDDSDAVGELAFSAVAEAVQAHRAELEL